MFPAPSNVPAKEREPSPIGVHAVLFKFKSFSSYKNCPEKLEAPLLTCFAKYASCAPVLMRYGSALVQLPPAKDVATVPFQTSTAGTLLVVDVFLVVEEVELALGVVDDC